ncbi:MAG: glycerate kinase [Desulfobacteraceae bacterium]|nr:glycerate kinase [Desulfobacteraceae bacterium]MBC2756296.1 glycerate kinase [Desulfobacteraceae bacterium]
MRILVAPNSLKESLSANEVGDQILQGLKLFSLTHPHVSIETRFQPICDGGTGFTDILTKTLNGKQVTVESYDPKYRPINTTYGTVGTNTAIIEVAKVAGLALLKKDERNPLYTSSYGVGDLLLKAWQSGARNFYIGCGDTAINDYGIGMLSALGVRFFDKSGKVIENPVAKDIPNIASQDLSNSLCQQFKESCTVTVACNLTSMLKGSLASSRVYAIQKGASAEEAEMLEGCADIFLHLADPRNDIFLGHLPGAGGAGGLAGALRAYLGAELKYSFEVVFECINFNQYLKWADLVITSEGLFDENSAKGKAPVAVALFAKRYNCETALLAGSVERKSLSKMHRSGLDWIEPFSSDLVDLSHYIEDAALLAEEATIRLMTKITQQGREQ